MVLRGQEQCSSVRTALRVLGHDINDMGSLMTG